MVTEKELIRRVQELMSSNSKMAGQISAIGRYMDAVGVLKIAPVQKRVELLTVLYRKLEIECEELSLICLSDKDPT